MTGELAAAYHSSSQRARAVTESWGESNLYCPNCSSPKLIWLEPGHPASDYSCPSCGFWYQLKSQKSRIGDSITDGAYAAMMNAIRHDELPSFYFMQYEIVQSPSPPQSGGEGRGEVVRLSNSPHPDPLPAQSRGEGNSFQTIIVPAAEVREKFKRVKPLKDIPITQRGWTLDVLNIVRRLAEERGVHAASTSILPSTLKRTEVRAPNEFTNSEIYAHARELEKLHPDNRHVRDKIRQQLQVLRDMGLLIHLGRGEWRLP